MTKPKVSDETCREIVNTLNLADQVRCDLEHLASELHNSDPVLDGEDTDGAAWDLGDRLDDLATAIANAIAEHNGSPDHEGRGSIRQALPRPWGR